MVKYGATKHICANRTAFSSYTSLGDEVKQVFLGDSRITPILEKGKLLLKLVSGKTLSLSDMLHVPSFRVNLISIALLGKICGIRI